MTAATALFMIPTALVFPAMMRIANTPPSSKTLIRVRKEKIAHKQQPFGGDEHVMSQHDRLVKTQREEFHAALSDGELQVGKKTSRNSVSRPNQGTPLVGHDISPNSFPVIRVLAVLIEGRWWYPFPVRPSNGAHLPLFT